MMDLRPEAFTPPPKVSSAVVHIKRRDQMLFEADEKRLTRIVALAFQQRRKMLRASLKSLSPEIEDVLQSVGIAPTERAENVSIEAFCALTRALTR